LQHHQRTRQDDWARPLAGVVRDRSGRTIDTRDAARRYILRLPATEQKERAWQQATKLLLDDAPAEDVTKQIELALFMSGKLKVTTEAPGMHRFRSTRRLWKRRFCGYMAGSGVGPDQGSFLSAVRLA
jgi:hypothetical protein